MTDSDFTALKQKLLERMISGEIDRTQYDEMLSEIEKQASMSVTDQRQKLPSNQRLNSIGEMATGVQKTSPSIKPGFKVGQFEFLKILGRGGMGEVWRANDTVGEREVVIKILPPELGLDAVELQRIKESFKRVHSLNHQNICPIYSLGQHKKLGLYLVMKFLEGGNLRAYQQAFVKKHQRFTLKETLRILKEVAQALDYAHSKKVIHRDIKPDNIMVSRDSTEIQLVDFGLAAEFRSTMSRVSQVQMDISGTYPYMAPEQWQGQYQDAKTDQYALAVVAHELMTGRVVFEAPDTHLLRQCVLHEPPAPLPNVPEHFNQALAKALAKKREDRFPSCEAFVAAMIGNNTPPEIVVAESVEIQENSSETVSSDTVQAISKTSNSSKDDSWRKLLPKIPVGLPKAPQLKKSTGLFGYNWDAKVPQNAAKAFAEIQSYLEAEKYEEAKWRIEVLLNRDPTSEGAWMMYFGCLASSGKPDYLNQSITAGMNLLRINESATAWTSVGLGYFHIDKYKEAYACYRRAHELDPKHYNALLQLCCVCNLKKQFKSAVHWGKQAVQADEPASGTAWMNLCIALHYSGNDADAHKAAQQAVRLGADADTLNAILNDPPEDQN